MRYLHGHPELFFVLCRQSAVQYGVLRTAYLGTYVGLQDRLVPFVDLEPQTELDLSSTPLHILSDLSLYGLHDPYICCCSVANSKICLGHSCRKLRKNIHSENMESRIHRERRYLSEAP